MRYYTNSEVQTFLRCRRKHYLGYVLQYEPAYERLVPPRLRGTLAHSALELYYSTGDDPLQFIHAERVRLVAEYTAKVETVDLDDVKTINSTIDLVHAMIEGYMQWVSETGADQDLVPLDTEHEVAVMLGPIVKERKWEEVALLGKLDARFRERSTGFTLFLDHKTVGDLVQLPKWAIMHPQLLFYHLLERLTQGDNHTDAGLFNMLRSVKRTGASKPPYYDRWRVPHNPEHLRNFWRQTLGNIDKIQQVRGLIEDGEDHQVVCPPSPRQECSWDCEFFSICPMMDDGSDYQAVLASAYKVGNPLERYRTLEKG